MQRMKSLWLLLVFVGTSAHANVVWPPQPPVLNQVSFQVSAEQWVTTKAPKVIIAVNAALSEEKLASAYGSISQKLQKIASVTPWQITTFERNQDKSGLEQLSVTAEARLMEGGLANLRSRLKEMSKPGETYSLSSIDYTPTLLESEAARTALRADIYRQIKNELAGLNAIYVNQKYVVHNIYFNEDLGISPIRPMAFAANASSKQLNTNVPLTVTNRLQLNARVELAAVMPST